MAIRDFFTRVFENVGGVSDSEIAKFMGGMFSTEEITNETGKTVKIDSSNSGIVARPLSSTQRLKDAENVVKDTDRDTSALEQKYVKDYFGSYVDLIKQTSKGSDLEFSTDNIKQSSKGNSDLKFSTDNTKKQSLGLTIPKDLEGIFKDAAQWESFTDVIASKESSTDGYKARGGFNDAYDGKYQMGKVAKQEAEDWLGIKTIGHTPSSRARFRNDRNLQEKYYGAYVSANHAFLKKTSKVYNKLSNDDKIGILGYAQQGQGNAREYVNKGIVSVDGNGVRGTKYIDALVKEMGLKVTSPSVFATIYKTKSFIPKKKPVVNTQKLRVNDRPFLRPNMKKESND